MKDSDPERWEINELSPVMAPLSALKDILGIPAGKGAQVESKGSLS